MEMGSMKRYHVALYTNRPGGQRVLLGMGTFYAHSESDARLCAIDAWWPFLEQGKMEFDMREMDPSEPDNAV